ncbi:GNAT family N-acetyltransferase [Candidatus Parcubacteria bacterium]|nr:GNAT family N-acetyltransferase [Candidatus Parcubacteria bacterium]
MAIKKFIIRDAKRSDLKELSRLAKETCIEAFGQVLTNTQLEEQIAQTRSEDYFNAILGKENIMLALSENQIVGYVQFGSLRSSFKNSTKNDRELWRLYIDSDNQGQGIGKALLETALNNPDMKKAKNIYLDVWDQNKRAINFYKKQGFKVVDKNKWYIDGEYILNYLIMKREQ